MLTSRKRRTPQGMRKVSNSFASIINNVYIYIYIVCMLIDKQKMEVNKKNIYENVRATKNTL